jgi:CRISPR/Cas system CMR subunit Cmr4 (Cas7 group RAMP superfamily)
LEYNNFKRFKITKQVEQKSMENDPLSSRLYKNEKDNKLDSLIIDDNTVYEIDLECFERAKRNRINQRTDRTRR